MKNEIELFRETQGLTYTAIAKMVGLRSRSTVFQHCRGKRCISAESALKYSRFLGIPLHSLRPDLWPLPDELVAAPAGERALCPDSRPKPQEETDV